MLRVITRHNINLGRDELLSLSVHALADRSFGSDEARRFEDDFAAYHGRAYAVALTSGRMALYAILSRIGLPAGCEIALPAYCFHSIPRVIEAAGFVPRFVPCDPAHFAIDPQALEDHLSPQTQALLVLHPFGQPAPMAELTEIAGRRGLMLIEDPSQSIGAELNGRKAGAFGHSACFSFVHGKNLTTFGGGMLLTDDASLYRAVLRETATTPPPEPHAVRRAIAGGLLQWALTTRPGYTAGPFAPFYLLNLLDRQKLDGLFVEEATPFTPGPLVPLANAQCNLGRLQLKQMDARNAARRRNAQQLAAGLAHTPVTLPRTVSGGVGTFNAFAVRVPDGPGFQRRLMLRGVDTRADYMSCFAFEEAWKRHGDVVYLPTHPGLNEADIRHVIRVVRQSLG